MPMDTWVFLRGLTREGAHWGTFPTIFQQALPTAHLVALDLPGNGQFHRMRSPLTVEAMAQACREEMGRLGLDPPYRLLALSLGAMVAIEWARSAPEDVAGCVLINTSVRPFSPFDKRLLPWNYPTLLWLMAMRPPAGEIERAVWALTSNQGTVCAATVKEWVSVRVQRPVSLVNTVRQLVAAARYRAPARAPLGNFLLLASTNDRLVSAQCSQALALAWGLELAEHPSAGHDLPLDDPEWVAGQVANWVLGTSAGTGQAGG